MKEILFVGALGKIEMDKVPQAGYQIVGLTIAGFNRQNIFKNLTLPFKLIKSFIQVRNAVAALNAFVQEHISGVEVVQAFAAEEKEMKKLYEGLELAHHTYVTTINQEGVQVAV